MYVAPSTYGPQQAILLPQFNDAITTGRRDKCLLFGRLAQEQLGDDVIVTGRW